MKQMGEIIASAFVGLLFGIASYIILAVAGNSDAFYFALIAAAIFALLTFIALLIDKRVLSKKYEGYENKFEFVFKTDGNISINDRVNFCRIYVSTDKLRFAVVNKKTIVSFEVQKEAIKNITIENVHMLVTNLQDKTTELIVPEAEALSAKLKENGYL